MQTTFLNCDKEQGTVEVTLSKREMQVDKAVIAADYRRLDKGKFEVTYNIGCAGYEILVPIAVEVYEINYMDLKEHIKNTIESLVRDSKTRKVVREKMKEIVEDLAVSYKDLKVIELDLDVFDVEGLTGYRKLRVIVEISKTEKTYKVYMRDMFDNILKVYQMDISEEISDNDLVKTVMHSVKKDVQRIVQFFVIHRSEMELLELDN